MYTRFYIQFIYDGSGYEARLRGLDTIDRRFDNGLCGGEHVYELYHCTRSYGIVASDETLSTIFPAIVQNCGHPIWDRNPICYHIGIDLVFFTPQRYRHVITIEGSVFGPLGTIFDSLILYFSGRTATRVYCIRVLYYLASRIIPERSSYWCCPSSKNINNNN